MYQVDYFLGSVPICKFGSCTKECQVGSDYCTEHQNQYTQTDDLNGLHGEVYGAYGSCHTVDPPNGADCNEPCIIAVGPNGKHPGECRCQDHLNT